MLLVSTCRIATTVVCCAMLAACDDGVAPGDPDVTLDSVFADFSDLGAVRDQLIGGMPLWLRVTDRMPAADSCPYDASIQLFVCPTTKSNGLTMTRSFQLLDVSSVPQSAFSSTKTAAIRTVADLNGTVEFATGTPPSTYRISSRREHTLTGLLSGTHTLAGIRSTTVDASVHYPTGAVTTSHTMVETTGLAMPKRGRGSAYPEAGTITSELESSESGQEMSVTLTFNGTSIVTRTIRINGETETCTVDLRNPDAAPVCYRP